MPQYPLLYLHQAWPLAKLLIQPKGNHLQIWGTLVVLPKHMDSLESTNLKSIGTTRALDSKFHERLGAKHLPQLGSLSLKALPDDDEERRASNFTLFLTEAPPQGNPLSVGGWGSFSCDFN